MRRCMRFCGAGVIRLAALAGVVGFSPPKTVSCRGQGAPMWIRVWARKVEGAEGCTEAAQDRILVYRVQ